MMQIGSLGQTEAVYNSIVPGFRPGELPQEWKDWIAQVAPLVPDIPPPTVSPYLPEGGPRPEWVDWLRAASERVPHIPPPEEIPPKSKSLKYILLGVLLVAVLYKTGRI